jgi:hypothetical protein
MRSLLTLTLPATIRDSQDLLLPTPLFAKNTCNLIGYSIFISIPLINSFVADELYRV